MTEPAQRLDRTGDRDVIARHRVEQRRPPHIAGPGIGAREILPGRALRRESIGLVLETADRDARHSTDLNRAPARIFGPEPADLGACNALRLSASTMKRD